MPNSDNGMKARLKSAPLASGDIDAFAFLIRRRNALGLKDGKVLDADRRDADLMLWAQGIRRSGRGLVFEHDCLSVPSLDGGGRTVLMGGIHWADTTMLPDAT